MPHLADPNKPHRALCGVYAMPMILPLATDPSVVTCQQCLAMGDPIEALVAAGHAYWLDGVLMLRAADGMTLLAPGPEREVTLAYLETHPTPDTW